MVRNMLGVQHRAYANAKAKGFHDSPRSISAQVMLIVTEIAEVAEEVRLPHFDPAAVRLRGDGKPEGFGPELADIVIRCGDTAESCGFLLDEPGEFSMRSTQRLWSSGDHLAAVECLLRALYDQSHEQDRTGRMLPENDVLHGRLSDLVNECFVLAKVSWVFLWAEIENKMNYNETRPRLHGKRL